MSAMPSIADIRFDREKGENNREERGVADCAFFVNKRWATQFSVCEAVSRKDYEDLTVSFTPFCLSQETGQITVILVYVPGPDNARAAERIARSYSKASSRTVDQPVFILRDFNSCDNIGHFPQLEQFDTFPTRNKAHSVRTNGLLAFNSVRLHLLIKRLLVQNFAAKFTLKSRGAEHAKSLLKQLHWLPIEQSIKYKIACHC